MSYRAITSAVRIHTYFTPAIALAALGIWGVVSAALIVRSLLQWHRLSRELEAQSSPAGSHLLQRLRDEARQDTAVEVFEQQLSGFCIIPVQTAIPAASFIFEQKPELHGVEVTQVEDLDLGDRRQWDDVALRMTVWVGKEEGGLLGVRLLSFYAKRRERYEVLFRSHFFLYALHAHEC